MITRIFLDLDDVLADFTMHTLRYMTGCKHWFRCNYDVKWGFDIVKAYNSMRVVSNRCELTTDEFWKNIPRRHWAALPKLPECDTLLEMSALLVGRENVCILSSPTEDPDCDAGKREWIDSFMPEWIKRQAMIGTPKYMCAHQNTILIDDSDKNVGKFREYGGYALLVPRPWNSAHDDSRPFTEIFRERFQFNFREV